VVASSTHPFLTASFTASAFTVLMAVRLASSFKAITATSCPCLLPSSIACLLAREAMSLEAKAYP
jgi:hypothetical protein